MGQAAVQRATIEQYIGGWASGDKASWLGVFAEGASFVDPVGEPAHEGKAAIEAFWDKVRGMGVALVPHVDRIVVCGQEGVLSFEMHATDAKGDGMALKVIDVFEFDEAGLVVSLKAYWDKGCRRRIVKGKVVG